MLNTQAPLANCEKVNRVVEDMVPDKKEGDTMLTTDINNLARLCANA